jgi:hypothetical protein
MEVEIIGRMCKGCGEYKLFECFSKHNNGKYGYRSKCKICLKIENKEWNAANPDYQKDYQREWKAANPDYQKDYQREWKAANPDYNKEWNAANSDYQKVYQKNRKLEDPIFKLRCDMRNLINNAFNGSPYTKDSKSAEYFGCSYEELIAHLESQFDEHMTWQNKGTYWHVDHFYSCASCHDEEMFKLAQHYLNLRPLEAKENIRKGSKEPWNCEPDENGDFLFEDIRY